MILFISHVAGLNIPAVNFDFEVGQQDQVGNAGLLVLRLNKQRLYFPRFLPASGDVALFNEFLKFDDLQPQEIMSAFRSISLTRSKSLKACRYNPLLYSM